MKRYDIKISSNTELASEISMQKKKLFINSYIFLAGASVLFMLLFAYNTSPLFEYIGVDSGMYLVMGKAMAQGKTLYSDLFDHKGPIIFIINMIPQLFIDETLGVWLIELILIMTSAIIIYKIAARHVDNSLSLIVPLIYIWVTVTLFNGGNYTEEYSNFFSVISLYIFDKWLRNKTVTMQMSYIFGLCFTFVFFMRPNNVALIISIIVFIGIDMIKNNPQKIRSTLIFGFLGIITVTLPIIIYHLYTGTLYDMFYATVLHNIKYCQVGAEHFRLLPNGNSPQLLCFFIALGIHIVGMCTCYSSNNIKLGNFILFSSTVIAFAILIGKRPYMYYWTLLAPLTAYCFIFIIKYGIKRKKRYQSAIALTLVVILMGINSFGATEVTEKKNYITEYKHNVHKMYNRIPDDEKDDCFAYNIPAMFIYEVDLYTPCKYFTMQTWMAKINPDIANVCTDYVKNNHPEWVLSYFDFKIDNSNPELTHIINTNYTQVYHNDSGYLYQKVNYLQ